MRPMGQQMSANPLIIVTSALAILALYCGFVLVMRSVGAELPDPAHLLPPAWRPY
jgi:hypothetical protein